MMKTWLKMVLVMVCGMGFLFACNNGSSSSNDSSGAAEERLGIDAFYDVAFNIGTCAVKDFNLEIGDQQSLSTRFGDELDHCYLYVPASGKTETYSFTETGSGVTLTRTVSVSGDVVTIDEVWDNAPAGQNYTGHFTLSFNGDLHSFVLRGSIDEEEAGVCDGQIDAGIGIRNY